MMEDYKIASRVHQARVERLRQNLQAAYTLIIEEFTLKIIRDQIQALPDFLSFERDPIELLKHTRAQMEDTF